MVPRITAYIRRLKNPAYSSIALAVFSILSLVIYPNLLPNRSFADTPEVTPSITIGGGGSLAFSVDPGSFASGNQSISVATSNYTGYTLTIAPTSGNSTELVNSVTSSTIPTITLPSGQESITSGSFGSPSYGFSLNGTDYKPVNTGSVIKQTSGSGTDNFSLYIGAKAASNTPAGSYTRQFTLTATTNPAAFAITYVENAGEDTVTNMPDSNEGTLSGATVTISDKTPVRSGYDFLGWAETSSATTPTIKPSGTFSVDAEILNSKTFYAVWLKQVSFAEAYSLAGKTQSGGFYKMQDMTPEICATVTPGQTATLLDTRDGQTYTVAKWWMDSNHTVSSAKCWMSSNLNLGDTENHPLSVSSLNSTNTHLALDGSKNVTATTFNSWKTTSGSVSYTNPEFIPITATNSVTGSDEDAYQSKYGTLYNFASASAGTYTYAAGAGTGNAEYDICPSGWRLATGGSGGEFQQLITDGYDIPSSSNGSIKLQQVLKFPLAGYFYNSSPVHQGAHGLYWSSTIYNGINMYRLNFDTSNVYTANYVNRYVGYPVRCIADTASRHTLTLSLGTGVESVEIDGTSYENGDTVTLYDSSVHNINMTFESGYEFDSWSATSGTLGSASTQSTTYTISSSNATLTASAKLMPTLQGWTGCDSMNVGETALLRDSRDNQVYTVSKLYMDSNQTPASARCWMMDNLNLGDTENHPLSVSSLNSTNTHLPTDGSKNVPVTDSDEDLTNDFSSWIKSSGSASYTNPELISITTSNSETGSDEDSYHNKYGTLYNYAATSAGTYVYARGAGTGNAEYDICPSGWRLPTGGDDGEFKQLIADGYALSGSVGITYLQSTLKFPLAGGFGNGTPYYQGVSGNYWTSTLNDNNNMYLFYFTTNGINPAAERLSRNGSRSVRCIAQTRHTVTISLSTGVESIEIDGTSYDDGDTVALYDDSTYSITMNFESGYEFNSWSATSGTIGSQFKTTTYKTGSTNATLTASGKLMPALQNWAGCSALSVGDTVELRDARDNQVYTVGKLKMNADGSNSACWMMDNLNLGAKSLLVSTLDGSNTHLPTDGSKNVPVTDSDSDPTNDFTSWIKSSGSGSYTNPELISVTGQDSYNNKYGTLYNYAAASAGTYTYAEGAGVGNAQYDICPSGWRLPTGGDSGEFKQLITDGYSIASTVAGSTKLQHDLKFSLAGAFYDGTQYSQASDGSYWSSTRLDGDYMFRLYFSTSLVNPTNYYIRYRGYSVRCISQTRHTLTIDFGGSGVASVEIDGTSYSDGATVSLIEGSSHTIAMTTSTGYEFDSWSISGTGSSVASTSTNSTTLTLGSTDATLTASGKSSKTYMQNWSGCSSLTVGETVTLYDNRDEQAYTVSKLYMDSGKTAANAKCWMMENLNLGDTTNHPLVVSTLDGSNTHLPTDGSQDVAASTFTNTWKKTSAAGTSTAGEFITLSGQDSYGNKYGTLYNFCAASAGTICASSNSSNASYDLCPSGWRLPTGGSSGEFKQLITDGYSIASSAAGSTALQATLKFPLAGFFNNGTPSYQGSYGRYLSSRRYDNSDMWSLYFNSSLVYPASYNYRAVRNSGNSVRCIAQTRHTLTIDFGSSDVESVEIDGTSYGDGDTVSLADDSTHSISMTTSNGYVFDAWSISGTGASVGSTSTNPTTVTMGSSDATLTASAQTPTYMQNFTNLQCQASCSSGNCTVYDRRDGSDYTVRYLADTCWMTQNLRITGTITATDSNNVQWSNFTSPSSFNVSQYDLETDGINSGPCASGDSSNPKGYSNVCSHYSAGDANTGNKPTAWYNYAAATAGSITGYSNSTDASSDICPSGWRLPTENEQDSLVDADLTGANFNPVHGGQYSNGSLGFVLYAGLWWSSTGDNKTERVILDYDPSISEIYTDVDYRYNGFYIRCVRSS